MATTLSPQLTNGGEKKNKQEEDTILHNDHDNDDDNNPSFPTIDLLPKRESQAYEFVRNHGPSYDGSNVVIGILDTGIDPGASGLRFMTDGTTPKLIDLVDCTGSGDVDIQTECVVTDVESNPSDVNDDNNDGYYQVTGLSGRTLKLKKSWWKTITPSSTVLPPAQPSTIQNKENDGTTPMVENGESINNKNNKIVVVGSTSNTKDHLPTVKLGIKPAYELFPASVVQRVKAYRKYKFEKEVNEYIANVQKELSTWQEKFGTCNGNSTNSNSNSNNPQQPTPDDIRTKEDIQAKLDVLTDKDWETDDPGMILDCVVFWDNELGDYRAVIFGGNDSNDDDDGPYPTPLAAYRRERQYGTISTVDRYNYGVNFYDNGSVLSIVGDCTPHGTHVAAIAAVADADGDDSRNGIAPGAQLISIKIGDSRLGSMETGSSIARGMMTAIRLGCDVINLSYGEGCQVPNAGRIVQLAEELVWRHNIVFVSAVGNNGPALSTVNAPGGLSSCILGVGAYVSPTMMKAGHSISSNSNTVSPGIDDDADDDETERLMGSTYTWSSVGPAVDGSNGVCICAPGGAITSVSNWTMQKSMLMNGTSMASPHACGCVALLLSASKAEGLPISPPRIQRAIESTAKIMPGLTRMQQGHGMIQVEDAYLYLTATKDDMFEDISFEVYVDNRPGNPRGIYLRQPEESKTRQSFSVRVNPHFKRMYEMDEASQTQQIDFEMQFNLSSTESWVTVPSHFLLMNNGRSFNIDIDPVNLPHGVHTASIVGKIAGQFHPPQRGAMWTFPITVIKPMKESRIIEQNNIELKPTEIKRFFVVPPPGATWMDVIVHDCRDPEEDPCTTSRLYVLHTVQLIPHAAYRDHAEQKYLNLKPDQTSVSSIPVEAGVTCEIDLGRYWSAAGILKADLKIEFRSVLPIPVSLSFHCGDKYGLVQVQSHLKEETISPTAKLDKWRAPLRPKSEGVISPLGERDVHPWNGKTTFQLVLSYEFTQDEQGAFTPLAPALQGVLYESTYESQLMLVYDGEKRYLGCVDAYPHSITAPKGSVHIKMQVRHDDQKMLDKLKDMTIWIERKLEKEISLTAYATREDLLIGAKRAMKKRTLSKGSQTSVFFSEPQSSKLPSGCKPGDILLGSSSYSSDDATLLGNGKRPGGFPLSYTVGPKMDKPADPELIPEPKDERTAKERIQDGIRDLKVDQLGKLTAAEKEKGEFEALYDEMVEEYPKHIPLLMANLKYVDSLKPRDEMLPRVITAANAVLAEISQDDLALHFGRKLDKDDPEKVKVNKEMEKLKNALCETLARQAVAYLEMTTEDAEMNFNKTLGSLKEWADIDANGKYAFLAIQRDSRAGRHGVALKRINKLLAKANGKDTGGVKPMSRADLLEARTKIFETLGYHALAKRDRDNRLVASPSAFKLF